MSANASLDDLKAEVAKRPMPRHVGIIMDGNGRWAQARGLARVDGHRAGSESVRAVTRTARQTGVGVLTLFAFSQQNWLRPPAEVSALMELLREYLLKERAEIANNGIRLLASGQLDRLPRSVREPLSDLCRASAGNNQMVLNLALSYGGREEIVAACRAIAEAVATRTLPADKVSAETLQARMWTGELPDLDLIIRTGAEKRVSNFMLWSAAYAELYFADRPWPDFREREFLEAVLAYQERERRFGKTSAQVRASAPGEP